VLVGPVLVGPVLVGPVLVGPVLVGPVLVEPLLDDEPQAATASTTMRIMTIDMRFMSSPSIRS
jgi:hypothetical protein